MLLIIRKRCERYHGNRLNGIIRLFLILLVFMDAGSVAGAESVSDHLIRISAIVNEQTHAVAKKVLKEAYGRIGYQVVFDDLPGRRALEWANSGLTDGDVARIKGTEKTYPNLIQVPTPVIFFKGVVFTRIIDRRLERWEDLRGLRIGVVRGVRYSTIGTQGMSPYYANDMTHLFTLLAKGRIEVAVAVLDAGKIEIHKNFRNSGIHVAGPPIFSAPLFHFLHKKKRTLVDGLNQVLAEMTASGEIEKLWQQAFNDLITE